jgi:hypothetical protein
MPADTRTVRSCFCETDAVKVSIRLSTLTYAEIGARVGVTKQAVEKWTRAGLPQNRTTAFQNATGTLLVSQYRAMERAEREAAGAIRERDRIASIASYSIGAAAA